MAWAAWLVVVSSWTWLGEPAPELLGKLILDELSVGGGLRLQVSFGILSFDQVLESLMVYGEFGTSTLLRILVSTSKHSQYCKIWPTAS